MDRVGNTMFLFKIVIMLLLTLQKESDIGLNALRRNISCNVTSKLCQSNTGLKY